MIVFLLLLLILAGLVYYYTERRRGPERLLKEEEGFDLIGDADEVRVYVYLKVYYNKSGGAEGPRGFTFDMDWHGGNKLESKYTNVNFTGIPDSKQYQLVSQFTGRTPDSTAELNALRRKYGSTINVNNWDSPLFRVKDGRSFLKTRGLDGQGIQDGILFYTNASTYVNTSGADDADEAGYGHWAVGGWSWETSPGSLIYLTYTPYIVGSNGVALYFTLDVKKRECNTVGNDVAKVNRSDITIQDGASLSYNTSLPNILDTRYPDPDPSKNYTNRAHLENNCKEALINGSHTFNRGCNQYCNTVYIHFYKYNIAYKVDNLEIFDGCNPTQDIRGNANIPRLLIDASNNYSTIRVNQDTKTLDISRNILQNGPQFILRLSGQQPLHTIGGTVPDRTTTTPIRYQFVVTCKNDKYNINFTTKFTAPISEDTNNFTVNLLEGDNTKFELIYSNNRNTITIKSDPVTSYRQLPGDEITFTIYVFPDNSVNERVVYNNTFTQSATIPNYIRPLYTGTFTQTTLDTSGKLYIQYDSDYSSAATFSEKNRISITFTYNNQSIAISAGKYLIILKDSAGTTFYNNAIEISKSNRFILNTSTGVLSRLQTGVSGESTIATTTFRELTNAQTIQMEIKDASKNITYYTSDPFTTLQTHYLPTVAPDEEVVKAECYFVENVDASGNSFRSLADGGLPSENIETYAQAAGGTLATISQLQADLAAGADWCINGWVQMRKNSLENVYRGAHPVTSRISDASCVSFMTPAIDTTKGVIDVDITSDYLYGFVCYGIKSNKDLFETPNEPKKYFKILPFNSFTNRWSRRVPAEKTEIFVVKSSTVIRQTENICKVLGFTAVSKDQLDAYAKDTPVPDNIIPAFVSDISKDSYRVLNDSADNAEYSSDGKKGVVAAPPNTVVNAYYCMGIKPTTNTSIVKNNVTYTIADYNARRRVWSKYSKVPYDTYKLVNDAEINSEKNILYRAAKIVEDIKSSGRALVKRSDKDLPYQGCDINAYGCIPTNATERETAPPPLVSKNNKYRALMTDTPLNMNDSSVEGIRKAIDIVLACQANNGVVPTKTGQYPGCDEGPCCVADEGNQYTLDEKMINEACKDPSADEDTADTCNNDQSPETMNKINFEPYKLSRVMRNLPTAPKCTNAKMSTNLKKAVRGAEGFVASPELYRDIHSTMKNTKLFEMKMSPFK